jgi:hypothetical protein
MKIKSKVQCVCVCFFPIMKTSTIVTGLDQDRVKKRWRVIYITRHDR